MALGAFLAFARAVPLPERHRRREHRPRQRARRLPGHQLLHSRPTVTALPRVLLWFAVCLLTACGGSEHSGFPADHCVDGCVAADDVLVVEPANALLLVGSERQLIATVVSRDGSRRDVTGAVTWASDEAGTVTVSAAGAVTGVSPGLSTVTAQLPTLEARANVLVSGLAVQELRVSPAYARVLPILFQQYTATAVLSDGTTVDVTRIASWSVSDGAIAHVDDRGLAQGLAEG